MFKDMEKEDLQKYAKSIQRRYAGLDLSIDQAVKMLELEENRNGPIVHLGNGTESFSFWERQDYEIDEAGKFLTDSQLDVYEKILRVAAEAEGERLKKQDAAQANEVALNEEYNTWLKDQFLPGVARELIRVPVAFLFEKEKIAFLRAEHKRFLAVSRQNAIVRHYRNSRCFEPNKLKLTLYYHERQALLPLYESFIEKADEGVRAVGNFLVDKYSPSAAHGVEFFRQKSDENKRQYADLRMRHVGEREIRGWHTTVTLKSDLTDAQGWLMAVMLMDFLGGETVK